MTLPPSYSLERKQVKHVRIRVNAEGSVRIIVPLDFTEDELSLLLHKKQSWIDEKFRQLTQNQDMVSLSPDQIYLYGERYTYVYWENLKQRVIVNHQHRTIQSGKNLLDAVIQEAWCRSWAHKTLTPRVQTMAEEFKFTYNRVYIRNQTTKWGNCSSKKNISLNWRLVRAPKFVIDYVILHELLHTEIMKHSQYFWLRLRSINPDYQSALAWLEKHGNAIG